MMKKEQYEELKSKYWDIASWAIWQKPGPSPKSNMRDVSFFEDENIIAQLNPSYVFVGLNGSGLHDDYMDNDCPWHNFHSSNPHGNDFKLRYALLNTPLWGAYITDIVKRFPEASSAKVKAYIREHPEFIKSSIKEFQQEIELLGTKPTLIALGNDVYEILTEYFSASFLIKHVHHYSYTGINKERYREEILTETGFAPEKIKRRTQIIKPEVESGKHQETTVLVNVDGKKLFQEKLIQTGLVDPDNWKGDIRELLIQLYSPAISNSSYELRYNLTDTTKYVIDLFRTGEQRRVMGLEKRKGQNILIFPTAEFYDEIKFKYPLPEPNPKKGQAHILIDYVQLWELLSSL